MTATYKADTHSVKTDSTRQSVLFQIAALMKADAPRLYDGYKSAFAEFSEALSAVTAANAQSVTTPRTTTFQIRDLPPAMASISVASEALIKRLQPLSFDTSLSLTMVQADPRVRIAGLLAIGRKNGVTDEQHLILAD